MNKTAVTDKVAARSGVPADVCTDVIEALEAVLQEELTAKGVGAFKKVASIVRTLASGKNA